MNRRRFIQSLAAVFSLPAVLAPSLRAASAAIPAATSVPTQARFWAIYMSGLHGECTPQTLQNLLHIPATDAKRYVTSLIADGVIKPHGLLQSPVSELIKPRENSLLDSVKERLDMKAQDEPVQPDVCDVVEPDESSDAEPEEPDEEAHAEVELAEEDEVLAPEDPALDGANVQA